MDKKTLTSGELFMRLLAVRTQLRLHETEAQLYMARAELAKSYGTSLAGSCPPLEAEALAELGAPSGARFDWTTFGFDEPPHEDERTDRTTIEQ